MGVGPVCQTSLSTGLSKWDLGPHHTEWSPIEDGYTGVTNGILRDLYPSHFDTLDLSLFRLVPILIKLLTFAPSSSGVFITDADFQRAVESSLCMVVCFLYSLDFKNDSKCSEGKEDSWRKGVT